MRDQFFWLYQSLKHKEYYYIAYQQRAQRWNTVITIACMITSIGGIAGLKLWNYVPWLWSLIIIASQFVQSCRSLFPFSKQLVAIKFLLPELSSLLVEIDYEWNKIDDIDDKKIVNNIHKYDSISNTLVNKYIGDIYFTTSSRCERKAEKLNKNYFHQKFC